MIFIPIVSSSCCILSDDQKCQESTFLDFVRSSVSCFSDRIIH
ncbi:hypothetical protein RUMLAC_01735 [[Ruminococcus] lactaris ATCC 29176]|uniref:Uncharacterized protein n=1 Tax=[Ruminococcus] lactaris ATCC 29176 TaxID=471875 RepID=B5CQI7_9FIRM|nr:hypothetical protein RUMLAC_01735 [[Ruminococcus] lactaris ATCC 29176]